MKVIDLTHPLQPGMPVYPEDTPPRFPRPCTYETYGFSVTALDMGVHTGTHMDAPYHMLQEGPTIDWFQAEYFVGKAMVVDLTEAGQLITPEHLSSLTKTNDLDFVLLRTGWDRHWGNDQYYRDWPELSVLAARFLTGLDLRGVGMDSPSPDPLETHDYEAHMALFRAGMVCIENLTNLELLPREPFTFSCLPLPIRGSDGSPCRAVAMLGI
ncbi:cyclase family protein [Salidesulfovibrio onnuriiensis]|uniref:cyclase family protein n=1 Tax=Salidesulfovibrio onnuriiensis TaxID=2583823 RepID=UPI0011C7E353|nr:cyclase family protein [Salidesulfovibrio onnuriiensis]